MCSCVILYDPVCVPAQYLCVPVCGCCVIVGSCVLLCVYWLYTCVYLLPQESGAPRVRAQHFQCGGAYSASQYWARYVAATYITFFTQTL